MARLAELLDRLEEVVEADPEAAGRLRPGLSAGEIERESRALAPFRFPADLLALYRWHDGFDRWGPQGRPLSLFFDGQFLSLSEALANYRCWLEVAEELGGGWCPAWFPAFGTDHGVFVTLGPRSSPAARHLWSYHSHEPEIYARYDSIETLVVTAIRLWEEQIVRPPFGDTKGHRAALATIAAFNPECFITPDDWFGGHRHQSEMRLVDSWLPEWKAAVGYEPETGPLPDPIPIARLDIQPGMAPTPIQGTMRFLAGSEDVSTWQIDDGTATVRVRLARTDTENHEQIYLGVRHMVWVVPTGERPPLIDPSTPGARVLQLWSAPLAAVKILPLYDD